MQRTVALIPWRSNLAKYALAGYTKPMGVAPKEVAEDFDFEETMRRGIHAEINELNAEAVELAERITGNFEELQI